MKIFIYLLGIIFGFVIITYIGLIFSKNINNKILQIFFWIIYAILIVIFLNIIMIAKFWEILQHKTGEIGMRGPVGDIGVKGDEGNCDNICKNIYSITELQKFINKELSKLSNKQIKNKNIYIDRIVKRICKSKQYNIVVNEKGVNNFLNYQKNIWSDWLKLIYDNSGIDFFTSEDADDNYGWKNINPFEEMHKYDLFHFGLQREFKKLNLEICSKPSNTLFVPHKLKPPLKIIKTNYYKWLYFNINYTNKHISCWRPIPYNPNDYTYENEVYYPVGDLIYIEDKFTNVFDKEHNINKSIKKQIGLNEFNIATIPIPPTIGFYTRNWHKGRQWWYNLTNRTVIFKTKNSDFPLNSIRIPTNMKIRKKDKIITQSIKCTVFLEGDSNNRGSNGLQLYKNKYRLDKDNYKKKKWGSDWLKKDGTWDSESEKATITTCITDWNDGGPDIETILITGDITPPIDFKLLYKNTNDCNKLYIWKPIAKKGYKPLGVVCTNTNKKPIIGEKSHIRCVSEKYLEKITPKYKSKINYLDLTLYSNTKINKKIANKSNGYNIFTPENYLYDIPDKYLTEYDSSSKKELEKENSDLAIGWFGEPQRESKYSIFTYLGVMPEGIITNSYTGRKYYIIHSQKQQLLKERDFTKVIATNSYNILRYNDKTDRYDKALAISGTNNVKIMPYSNADIRQIWMIEFMSDGKFRLKSKETNRYLYHDVNNNLRSDFIEKQVKNKDNTYTIFMNNKSAFGPSLNTMKITNKHTLDKFRKGYKNDVSINKKYTKQIIDGVYNP